MKKIQLLAALSAVLIGFSACSGSNLPSLPEDEAREALASSNSICMNERKTSISVSTDIEADEAIAGHLKEKGFFDSRYVYSIDGEDQFYIKHVWTEDEAFASPGYDSGETEAYYDMDENCLGYMQEIYRTDGTGSDYFFFDAEGKPKDYHIPGKGWTRHGAVIYDRDGNEAGRIDIRRWFGVLLRYRISISLDDDAAEEFSEMDRIAMLQKTELLISNTPFWTFFDILVWEEYD